MRSLALIFLCFCLVVSGTAAAMPMVGMAIEAIPPAMATAHDCSGMADVAAMPPVDAGAVPGDDAKPDCCRGKNCCGLAQSDATRSPTLLPQPVPTTTTVVATGSVAYASPALARLARPPIS